MAELHADLFSRHASPLDVYVFAAVDDRSEDVMSDNIFRRCNGKQQRRRRGGRSVQLSNWFMILHSSSRHLSTWYTYYVLLIYARSIRTTYYARPNTFGENTPRRSGLGMDM